MRRQKMQLYVALGPWLLLLSGFAMLGYGFLVKAGDPTATTLAKAQNPCTYFSLYPGASGVPSECAQPQAAAPSSPPPNDTRPYRVPGAVLAFAGLGWLVVRRVGAAPAETT
jgi:hypothetical protein